MLYFKDLETEIVENLRFLIDKKHARRCPMCKAPLVKEGYLQHYTEVASVKMIEGILTSLGLPIPPPPSPDYRFKCKKCGAVCIFVDGRYIPINRPLNKF